MRYTFNTKCTCSVSVSFDLDDGIVKNVEFVRGCMGNTKGVSSLAEGMKAEDIVKKLEGIDCGGRGTSCPDQLAKAIKKAMNE